MPREKRKPIKEIPEEIPEGPLTPPEEGLEEVPKVGLRPTGLAEDKEATWVEIESAISALKDDFIAGRATLNETIDKLVSALNAIRTAKAPGLRGLGEGPMLEFPGGPIPPEEPTPVV
jgi:hypothetical protein